ncbi:MAG: radical SAM protein, partial [Lachnospiraceae bacterium]|nr:radical SAM protein [Lachnospiraceae bacterium]
WQEIWYSEQAKKVREQVKQCQKNCWMIGSASPAMKQRIWAPGWWIIKHKLFMHHKYHLKENKFIS